MKALLLTLGHNASAVFYDGASKPIGYEEERLTQVKGDSRFPRNAIKEIMKRVDIVGSQIMISHWFDTYKESDFLPKYYDRGMILDLINNYGCKLFKGNGGLSNSFTHHDAHAYSAYSFLENYVPNRELYSYMLTGKTLYVVADGFGNSTEVLSMYEARMDGSPKLLHRAYGYRNSLGLMYQYATSFCGMKENQDEYKFLGYESDISNCVDDSQLDDLDKFSTGVATAMATDMYKFTMPVEKAKTHINLDELGTVKTNWHNTFANLLSFIGAKDYDQIKIRTIIGYFVQAVIEKCLSIIVGDYNPTNLVLSGGCFYNVKLNNRLHSAIDGSICIMPLSGDQGAAFGIYRKFAELPVYYHDMCFGQRDLTAGFSTDGAFIAKSRASFVEKVAELLKQDKIVNIVRGDMEFGPRALCHTTTLALPTKENVDYINKINGRNTVMPMAPVMTREASKTFFASSYQLNRIIGSESFMIITQDVDEFKAKHENLMGVVHKYPLEEKYSARPQIVDQEDDIMQPILEATPNQILINTSYNTHGTPILYSLSMVVEDFKKQKHQDSHGRVHLVILSDKP